MLYDLKNNDSKQNKCLEKYSELACVVFHHGDHIRVHGHVTF